MFGLDRIRVSDRIRLNPYPFKKIGFYPYPYPLSSQRVFLLFDRIGSGRKSTDTDTFAISICDALKSGVPLTTRQPTEYSWMSGSPTPLMKIGQSLLCTGSSTQGT